jgi:hypothetical protein
MGETDIVDYCADCGYAIARNDVHGCQKFMWDEVEDG